MKVGIKFWLTNGEKHIFFYNCLYDLCDDLLHGDLIRYWRECSLLEIFKLI